MTKKIAFYLLSIFCLITSSYALAATPPANVMTSLPEMLHRVMPAVVNVSAQGELTAAQILQEQQQAQENPNNQNNPNPQPATPASRQFESLGSGVIVDAEKGYVITNAHVIQHAKTITVTLSDGRKVKATLVGTDPLSDVAVLQIKADKLTVITFGNSDTLKVGDFVTAIGNPFGLNQTVTSGIISGLRRSALGIENYEDFIQTDASINLGNSGGALTNQQGQLIGINTAILAPNGGNIGIGFAIPVNMARNVMLQLIQYGSVRRGLMGVMVQDFTPDLADAFHLPNTQGAVVPFVVPDSPAEKAGMKPYDIIQKINDKNITNASEVHNIIGLLRVGSKVSVQVLRDGKPINLTVDIADPKQTQQESLANNPYLFGVAMRNFDEIVPGKGRIHGVMLLNVKEDSAAWRAGLRRGDVIVYANHQVVGNIDQMLAAAKLDKQQLLVNIFRGNGAQLVVVK